MAIFLDVEKSNSNGFSIGFIFQTHQECFDLITALSDNAREQLKFEIEDIKEV